MKNLGILFGACMLSAILSIAGYRYFLPPVKEVIIKESAPAMYTNYSNEDPLNVPSRAFLSSSPTNFIAAAEAVTPAVVNIKASNGSEGDWWGSNNYSGSSGSGVIISPDGYIVTNNHVIEEGRNIEVTLNDKRKYSGQLVGVDRSTDLALVKIDAPTLPYLTLGNSDSIRIGEWVLAVGNPFNLESTVTAGIVSAKGRSIDILDDDYRVESFIQTDAAVNPGNSGGALVNTNGELVGINTAIITRSGRYEGYSFAIPSNLARKVIKDLKDYGVVQRAILGVRIDAVTSELADELNLRKVEGVYITSVTDGSGADEAGIRGGDVINRINGVKTKSIPELQEQIARFRPGNAVEVEYIRNGKKRKTKVLLTNTDGGVALMGVDEFARKGNEEGISKILGFELRELTSSEKRKLKTKGAYVISITRGSKIERTNMDPGFIITKVNDRTINSVSDAIEELGDAKGKVMLEGIYEGYPDVWYYAFPK
ncbi:MAG: trypsin-like peptidase domain-containing protein [Saprospiraceae bacterium]